jgi:hypothetical protein
MNNLTIILVVIIVILLLLGYFYYNKTKEGFMGGGYTGGDRPESGYHSGSPNFGGY